MSRIVVLLSSAILRTACCKYRSDYSDLSDHVDIMKHHISPILSLSLNQSINLSIYISVYLSISVWLSIALINEIDSVSDCVYCDVTILLFKCGRKLTVKPAYSTARPTNKKKEK